MDSMSRFVYAPTASNLKFDIEVILIAHFSCMTLLILLLIIHLLFHVLIFKQKKMKHYTLT